ncbi:MAG TPA: M23 family metallopeptidase [Bryobacteraceae bacterium]|nr:M23 family metallopeptidase [Bryobacteraceae bacterium]
MKKRILKNIIAVGLFLMPCAFVKAGDTGACDSAPLPQGSYRMSSPFGMRLHPIQKVWRMHEGIDLAADAGTPVSVVSDGIVIIAGPWGCYGNAVVVVHRGDIVTLYAHLSRIAVRKGKYVRKCQIIGNVGATGCVTGAHLHFEVWKGKGLRRINPAVLLAARRS